MLIHYYLIVFARPPLPIWIVKINARKIFQQYLNDQQT